MVSTVEWKNGAVLILDQSRLPLEVTYIECTDFRMVAESIRKLCIRGAPAIGIAAAMGIALAAQDVRADSFDAFVEGLGPAMQTMLDTRPTAVNIRWAVERMQALLRANREQPLATLKALCVRESQRILDEDIETNKAIGRWGAEFIRDGDTVLTHCNAGSLATGGYGTATAPMLVARGQGKRIQVIADETRPVLQGARLTAWELMQEGIPVTLITDGTAGALMRKGLVDLAVVGTDRTTRNGDVANKIGTYTVAVLCREHRIPFYVAAPLSSVDFSMASGDLIPIEERSGDEVAIFGGRRIAPLGVSIMNLAFDVTPASYVTAFFTEQGPFRPRDLRKLTLPDVDIEGLRMKPPCM
jgi:methylthioribose-1-phosphate isomerase